MKEAAMGSNGQAPGATKTSTFDGDGGDDFFLLIFCLPPEMVLG
jgi:hypothetical protein